ESGARSTRNLQNHTWLCISRQPAALQRTPSFSRREPELWPDEPEPSARIESRVHIDVHSLTQTQPLAILAKVRRPSGGDIASVGLRLSVLADPACSTATGWTTRDTGTNCGRACGPRRSWCTHNRSCEPRRSVPGTGICHGARPAVAN